MKSCSEAGLWSRLGFVFLVDAAAALAAAAGLFDFYVARGGAVSWPLFLVVLAIAGIFLAVSAVSGFYRPQLWFHPHHLVGRAILALLILFLTLLTFRDVDGWPTRSQAPYFWMIPIIYVLFLATFRFVLAAAVRGGVLPPLLGVVRCQQAAGAGGFGFGPTGQGMPPGQGEVMLHPVTALPTGGGTHPIRRAQGSASAAPLSVRGGYTDVDTPDAILLLERSRGRVDLDTLPANWLDDAAIAGEGRASRSFRRAVDILGSLTLIVAVLPLLLLTALAIRIESRGPVFYRQERVGKGGRVFTLYKFRSMTADAERDGPCWAVPRDPRVTRVGRLIRLTRIDEVPQVINVLRGEMALIGPRPERPGFVDQLSAQIPHYQSRSAVKPGITGWAQVNYPYGASVEDARNKLAYDLYYIRHRSLAMDASILVSTVRVVVLQEGAR